MNAMDEEPTPRICPSEGCRRPVEPGERFCEACSIEWTLYQRETRQSDPSLPNRRSVR
jgi:hypothetical protein